MNFLKIRSFIKIGGWKKNRNSLNYDLSKAIFGMKMARELGHCMMVWNLKTKTKKYNSFATFGAIFHFYSCQPWQTWQSNIFRFIKKISPYKKFLLIFFVRIKEVLWYIVAYVTCVMKRGRNWAKIGVAPKMPQAVAVWWLLIAQN